MDGRADDPPHRARSGRRRRGAEAPAALLAGQWSGPEPYDLGGGAFTAAVSLTVAAAAVEWTQSPDAVPRRRTGGPAWRSAPGRWRLDSADGSAPLRPRAAASPDRTALAPRTGGRSPWSPVSEDRRSLELPAAGRPFPPVLLLAPALAGSGRIGAEVRVAPGRWAGLPAPALDLQWCRDGTADPRRHRRGLCARRRRRPQRADLPGRRPEQRRGGGGGHRGAGGQLPGAGARRRALRGDLRPGQRRAGGAGRGLFHRRGSALRRLRRRGRASTPRAWCASPPTPPLSEEVTVTARNSGGAVSSGFMVTVEPAEAELWLAADRKGRKPKEAPAARAAPAAAGPGGWSVLPVLGRAESRPS